MIKNGFYSYGSKALDGVDGEDSCVTVLRDGGIRGGTSFFCFVDAYSCCCASHEDRRTITDGFSEQISHDRSLRVGAGRSGTRLSNTD